MEKNRITSYDVFHVFSESLAKDVLDEICQIIEQADPNALYMGCSTNGNIFEGNAQTGIVIVCTVFEYPSTQIEISAPAIPSALDDGSRGQFDKIKVLC